MLNQICPQVPFIYCINYCLEEKKHKVISVLPKEWRVLYMLKRVAIFRAFKFLYLNEFDLRLLSKNPGQMSLKSSV